MSKVKYSIIIHSPSEDVDPAGREQIHMTLALQSLDSLYQLVIPKLKEPGAHPGEVAPGEPFPYRVTKYFMDAEDAGNLRAEVLDNVTWYKMYIKPEDE